jgi:hypothetical protein
MYRIKGRTFTAKTTQILRPAAIGAMLVTAITMAPALADDQGHGHQNLGPGCAPDRPAVAHHAGGVLATLPPGQAKKAPIPCSTATGWRTGEISLVVTNMGTLLFEPAIKDDIIGVIRSTDKGASWTFINPGGNPLRNESLDEDMWVDRDTGRIFWSNSFATPLRVDHSDTDGVMWAPSSSIQMSIDHSQIFSGPPPKNLKKNMPGFPNNYPNVLYIVDAGGGPCGGGGTCGTFLSKSLDGGLTWSVPVAVKFPAECPFPGNNPVGGYGLKGIVDKDGTIYLPLTPCQRPYVVISQDEGDTWKLSLVADTEAIGWGTIGLGMDKAGNLYSAWVGFSDRLPYLAISRDNAKHWSVPMMIAAPGVNEAAEPVLVAGKTGQVVVTYYGSKNSPGIPFPALCLTGSAGIPPSVYSSETASLNCPPYKNETWSTYVTESFNALAHEPLFWSATLNDPSKPTWYGLTPSSMRVAGQPFTIGSNAFDTFAGHVDYYSMTMAPDGTPWVGFFQECPFGRPVQGNPNCPATANGGPDDGLWGFVGRLVRQKGDDEGEGED